MATALSSAAATSRPIKDPAVEAKIDALLGEVGKAQDELRTMSANVTEVRTLALLAEEETLEGQLVYEKPGRIRWEYASPQVRIYLLDGGELVGWIPDQNRVEKLDLGRHESRMRRLVALGQDEEELRREFRVHAALDQATGEVDHLVLIPRLRRVRKSLRQVEIWLHEDLYIPRRIRYETGEGDVVDIHLNRIAINPKLAPGVFSLDIPADAEVVDGVSSLGFGRD